MWLQFQKFCTDFLDAVHMSTCFCHLSFRNLNSRLQKKSLAKSMNDVMSLAPSWEQSCPVCSFMDSLSASKSSPIWAFSFHAPLSFCCQQIKPKFSWEQFETFASIERFAFSGDVVYLNAFIPVMFEITKDLTSATQSMLFFLLFVFLLNLALDLLPGLIGLPLRARPLLFPVS